MEPVSLYNEPPSVVRQRRSSQLSLSSSDIDTLEKLCQRRRSSTILLTTTAPLMEDDDDKEQRDPSPEEGGVGGVTKTKQHRSSHRVSVVGRRASTFTKFFALVSTSESFTERGFLRPTLINAMLYFEDPNPSVETIREVMVERLLDNPRFRSIFRLDDKSGHVHWDPIPRPSVDMKYHITKIEGRDQFNEQDVNELITDSYLTDWDMSKPLWKMKLVTNFKDGRSLLFCTIDHAIGDGVAMLTVMLSLLDDPPVAKGGEKVKSFQKKRRSPADSTSKLRWSHRIVNFMGGVKDGIVESLAPPMDPPNPFKIPIDQANAEPVGKDFVQTRPLDLDEIKVIKNKLCGATVNDVVLALHAIALRKYLEEETKDSPLLKNLMEGTQKLHGEFPVNVRRQSQSDDDEVVTDLGNAIVTGLFALPFDFTDPIDAVFKCKYKIDFLKSSPVFVIKKVLMDVLVPNIPPEIFAKKIEEEGGSRSTMMISNVMGPPTQTSMAGYTLDDLNFTASYPGGLYCGVLSYNNQLRISMIVDKLASGNATKLKQCMEDAYDDLKTVVLDAAPGAEDTIKAPEQPIPLFARLLEAAFGAAVLSIPVFIARHMLK